MSLFPDMAGRSKRVRAALQTQRGRAVLRAARWALVLGVLGWLGLQLSSIGWGEVWASRPRTPWFYVIWLVLYLQLPLIEAVIYRVVWGAPMRTLLPPILRKRALNQDLVSYSGEAYFFGWARRHLDHPDRLLIGTLKDNAIASALATWTAAILLLCVFLATDQIVLTDLIGDASLPYVTAGVVLAAGVVGLGFWFRGTLLTLEPRTVLGLYGTHFARFLVIVYVLQILQWWVVLPEAPLEVWATMLAVITVVNRLPLLPAKDLIGIGAVLGMTGLLEASASVIAAMLLTRSVLDKIANAALFGGTLLIDRIKASSTDHTPAHEVTAEPASPLHETVHP